MSKKTKICIFTGNRSDYGLLQVLGEKLEKLSNFELSYLVSGSHLSEKFGYTLDEILSSSKKNIYKAEINNDGSNESIGEIVGSGIKKYSTVLEEINPDCLIVLGDRYETYAVCIAAYFKKIKIAHIHGGETTLGAMDDKLRDAITLFSTFHFTSAERHSKKIEGIQQSNSNIVEVGPMAIDGLKNLTIMSKKEFEDETGYKFKEKNILVTYHPVTMEDDNGLNGLKALLNAIRNLRKENYGFLFTSPNADNEGIKMQEQI